MTSSRALTGPKLLLDALDLEGELRRLDSRGQRHQPWLPMRARISGDFKPSLVTSSTPSVDSRLDAFALDCRDGAAYALVSHGLGFWTTSASMRRPRDL